METQPAKLSNNEQFTKYLADYPPQYNLGETVIFYINEKSQPSVGTIVGRIFKEREKTWKYTCKLHATNFNVEAYRVICPEKVRQKLQIAWIR